MSAPAGPIAELREIADRGSTGEFICASSAVEVHVYLQRGRVAWATASSQPFEFIRYVKEHASIDDATLRHVIEECRREKLPLGETLVGWGLAPWELVRAALAHQVRLALRALLDAGAARTMFLERPRFTEYDADLTLDLAAVVPAPPRPPSIRSAPPGPQSAGRPGFARQLLDTIEGTSWVELLESERVVDSAPPGPAARRVPLSLVRRTLGDDADFVALRSTCASVVGARLGRDARTLWFSLAADSTFGAAVSTLWSMSLVEPRPVSDGRRSRELSISEWTAGDCASADAAEIRLVLERAREVLAAIVLDADARPVFGAARRDLDVDRCLDVLRRRLPVFALGGIDEPGADPIAFPAAKMVTGERDVWCFGAELVDAPARTLWVITDRATSQGVGWACLTALGRGLASVRGPS